MCKPVLFLDICGLGYAFVISFALALYLQLPHYSRPWHWIPLQFHIWDLFELVYFTSSIFQELVWSHRAVSDSLYIGISLSRSHFPHFSFSTSSPPALLTFLYYSIHKTAGSWASSDDSVIFHSLPSSSHPLLSFFLIFSISPSPLSSTPFASHVHRNIILQV